MTPRPPIVIRPGAPGRVVVRGCPRSALSLLVLDRTWDPVRNGWSVSELAVDVVADWAARNGRSLEVYREVAP